jgi:Stage II sporulation protein E (SpoIIE)
MTPTVAAFWAPKAGSTADDFEDAFCCDPVQGRFSVADGASESSFAARWAKLLTEGYVAKPPDGSILRDWLRPLQEDWARGTEGRPLPWYAEEKARSGAFSSLLGVCLDATTRRWRAVAMGDSCLFIVRAGKVLSAFPLNRSVEFHNRPALLSSAGANVWSAVREDEGAFAPGDTLLLMTDALAAWFLAETELKRRPWAVLARAQSQEQFDALVELLRVGRALRNDDVTLVRVEVAP